MASLNKRMRISNWGRLLLSLKKQAWKASTLRPEDQKDQYVLQQDTEALQAAETTWSETELRQKIDDIKLRKTDLQLRLDDLQRTIDKN